MQQVRVLISGFVQGVGFRHFVRSEARKRSVTGWVCNTQDGGVEAILQGSKEKIEQMVQLCRKGPFLAEVKDVVVVWEDAKERYEDFTVVA
ncbi:MAG: acylphosphatase [Candidatus Levybacteria bacterium]|nr:acylphosphatase [Candidatus Levybacteria bacterium]